MKDFEKAVKKEVNKKLRELTPRVASDINKRVEEKWDNAFGELPEIHVTSTPVQLTKNGVKDGDLHYSWDADDKVSDKIREIIALITKE